MKVQSIASSLVALATTTAVAQEYNTSAAFNLYVAESTNSSLIGWILSACHAGAAIEGLCVYNDGPFPPSTTFFHNSTDLLQPPSGPLIWELPTVLNGNQTTIPSPMALSYVPWSNIAVPLFKPGYEVTTVGFDDDGKLFLVAFGDDRIHDPYDRPTTPEPRKMYNWFVCWAYVGNYYYHALAWATVLPPQNPTCQAVNVTRTFIEPASQTPDYAEPTLLAEPVPGNKTAASSQDPAPAEPVEPVELTQSQDSVNSTEAAKSTESADIAEPVELDLSQDSANSTETTEPAGSD